MEFDDLKGKRVVVCEDEGIIMMQLDRALRKAGLVVVGNATTGKQGLEIVQKEKPDIVLMDVRMPVMDGLEAARQIMAHQLTCIVILTATSDEMTMEQARSFGVAGYIPKPITSDSLLPALQQALQMFYECHP